MRRNFQALFWSAAVILSAAMTVFGAERNPDGLTVTWTDGTKTVQIAPFRPEQVEALRKWYPFADPTPATQPTTAPVTPPPPPVLPAVTVGPSGWTLPVDAWGWTLYPNQANVVVVCVDPAGNDTNPGTAAKPVKTLKRAGQLLPSNRPYQLWLKAGADYGSLPKLPNGTKDAPNVVRTWGSGRAEVNTIFLNRQTGIILLDLKVSGDDTGTQPVGVEVLGCQYVAVEGCEIAQYRNGLVIEDEKPNGPIIVRRNVIHDNRPPKDNSQHAQGVYFNFVKGLYVEGNYLLCNGWVPGPAGPTDSSRGTARVVPTVFNQNCYTTGTCDEVTWDNNWTAYAGATGAQIRSGGNVRLNVFANNPEGLTWGLVNGGGPQHKGGVTGEITSNLFDGTRDIAGMQRGGGLTVSNVLKGSIVGNYFLNVPDQPTAFAILLAHGDGVYQKDQVGIHNLLIANNQARNWANGLRVEFGIKTNPQLGEWTISGVVLNSNRLGKADIPPASGTAFTGSGQAVSTADNWQGLDGYARSLGYKDRYGMILDCFNQSRARWKTPLEAKAAVSYVANTFHRD